MDCIIPQLARFGHHSWSIAKPNFLGSFLIVLHSLTFCGELFVPKISGLFPVTHRDLEADKSMVT